MAKLTAGEPAPAFDLRSTDGRAVSLASLRGKRVVLYFYPEDDTPGCTKEACAFRDAHSPLRAAGVEVYGVSADDVASHERFRAKYQLPFALLVDPDNAVATAYGAWGEKVLYGKKVTGTIRSTFAIDAEGKIARAWYHVKVPGHAERVCAELGVTLPEATAP
jgi:peroxiredoxin Q/BCP